MVDGWWYIYCFASKKNPPWKSNGIVVDKLDAFLGIAYVSCTILGMEEGFLQEGMEVPLISMGESSKCAYLL